MHYATPLLHCLFLVVSLKHFHTHSICLKEKLDFFFSNPSILKVIKDGLEKRFIFYVVFWLYKFFKCIYYIVYRYERQSTTVLLKEKILCFQNTFFVILLIVFYAKHTDKSEKKHPFIFALGKMSLDAEINACSKSLCIDFGSRSGLHFNNWFNTSVYVSFVLSVIKT